MNDDDSKLNITNNSISIIINYMLLLVINMIDNIVLMTKLLVMLLSLIDGKYMLLSC